MVNMMKTKLLSTIAMVLAMQTPLVKADTNTEQYVALSSTYGCIREGVLNEQALRIIHTAINTKTDVIDVIAAAQSDAIGMWIGVNVLPNQLAGLYATNFEGEDILKDRGMHLVEILRGIETVRVFNLINEIDDLEMFQYLDIDKTAIAFRKETMEECTNTVSESYQTISNITYR